MCHDRLKATLHISQMLGFLVPVITQNDFQVSAEWSVLNNINLTDVRILSTNYQYPWKIVEMDRLLSVQITYSIESFGFCFEDMYFI